MFSLKLKNLLEEAGYFPKNERQNKKFPEFKVFYYEYNDKILEIINTYQKGK